MNKRGMYTVALAVLLMGVVTVTSGVWLTGSFSHGEPGFDQGCYCHNNGISIYVNATGDGDGGVFFGPFAAGSSFHLLISTNATQTTGVVPGLQLWESNQSDNAKFTISPAQVNDGSAQDRSPKAGNITALYKITAPATAGFYTLTLYAQGSLMQGIAIQVTGGTTTTSTTSSTTHTTSTTTSTTSSTPTTSTTSSTTSTSSSTSTHSTSSTTSTTAQTSTSTTKTSGGPVYSISVATNSLSYSATVPLIITGAVSPAPAVGTAVVLQITSPQFATVVYNDNVTLASDGTFSFTVNIVANSTGWVPGTYTLTVSTQEPAPMTAMSQFFYTPHVVSVTSTSSVTTVTTATTYIQTSTVPASTVTTTTITTAPAKTLTSTTTTTLPPITMTSTQTVTGPASTITATQTATQTITGPASTVTNTATSTVTQTTSVIPDWAYGVMAVLLLAGLAIGYVVKRPSTQKG
jgi:hypothetical protein